MSVVIVLGATGLAGVAADTVTASDCETTSRVDPITGKAVITVTAGCDGEAGPAPRPPDPPTPEERWIALGCNTITGEPYTEPRTLDDGTRVAGATMSGPTKLGRVEDPVLISTRGWDLTAEYSYYRTVCAPGGTSPTERWVTEIFADTDPVPIPDLLAQAKETLAPPDPDVATSPVTQVAGRHTFVQFDTWFWTENDTVVVSEEATAGFVTVVATARFGSTVWDPGDGSALVVCETPGLVWRPGMDGDESECSHVYRRASRSEPGGEYSASAVTTWNITWTQNGADQGPAGSLTTETTFGVPVKEIQTVVRTG